MKTSFATSGNAHRYGLSSLATLAAVFAATAATAACPPGYHDKSGYCVPVTVHTHHSLEAQSYVRTPGAVPLHAKPNLVTPKMIDRSKVKPQPGVPIEHTANASNTHGIIFVGGKQALNPQPIPPGKVSLNPQPIPPGHAIKVLPRPGAPIEQPVGH